MQPSDDLPVYIVFGSEPGSESTPLNVFAEVGRADQYLLDGLMTAMVINREAILRPGEQVSLLVTVGNEADGTSTSGSVVTIGEDGRNVWDFRVEKRWAPAPSPVR